MNTRRDPVRTIKDAFDSLTIDGRRLDPIQAHALVEAWVKTRKPDEQWKEDLLALITELTIAGGSSIAATTSGTTGPPKHIRIPRRDLVNSARLTAQAFGLHENDRVLLCLPCSYIAGKMMVVRAMALGLNLHVIDPRGSVLGRLKVQDMFRFTSMVPIQLHRALQEDRQRVEEQFHTILLGGGPVSNALEEDLQGLRTKVFHGYASTETVTHAALRRLNGKERGTAYHAVGRVTFAQDKRGCLVVNTPHLVKKQHITNDLVKLEDATHFHWLGRADNVILSGGKKIYPEQLEAKTAGIIPYAHFFMAKPDAALGQAVMLVLETEDGPQAVDDVRKALAKVLTAHEMPRRVTALRAFRRTASGKVVRTVD